MNVRLKKEFQSLFWPWLVAALISIVPLLSWMLPTAQFDQSFSSIYVLASIGFVLGIALLATLPFGEEFNLRTMSILLSHPISRWQIWTEKFKITLILTLPISLLNFVSILPLWGLIGGQLKLALAFLIFTVSSGAFWVLFARSTIGGTVLCLFSQAVVTVMVYSFTQERYFAVGIWNSHIHTEGIILRISLLASPIFLWLGWKLFSRLQDNGSNSLEIPFLNASASNESASKSWLRSRSDSPRLNLLFKELSHFRPLLLMAYLFSALWIGMLLLSTFYPLKNSMLTDMMNGFLAIYTGLILVTSGCISLGEEKEIGIHACNLALPIAWRRQWLLKLSVGLIMGGFFAIILPLLMTKFEALVAIHPMKTWVWHLAKDTPILLALCLMLTSFVTVSFWAATVTKRTIHAAFLAGFIIMLVAVFHTMGKSMHQGSGYLTSSILDWATAYLQLDLGWPYEYTAHLFFLSFTVIGLIFLPLSRFHFQNQASPRAHITKTAVLSITLSWMSGFVLADIRESAFLQLSDSHPFRTEPRAALLALKADVWPEKAPPNRTLLYPSESLLRTGKISPLTAKWLEGSGFNVEQTTFTNSYDQKTYKYISAYLERLTPDKYMLRRPLMHTNVTTIASGDSKK